MALWEHAQCAAIAGGVRPARLRQKWMDTGLVDADRCTRDNRVSEQARVVWVPNLERGDENYDNSTETFRRQYSK